jgi:hypothetical protein
MKPAIVLLEPTNLLLLSCALIYGLIGEPTEAAILLAFVVGISLLDAIQQQRSNRALAELARLSAPLALREVEERLVASIEALRAANVSDTDGSRWPERAALGLAAQWAFWQRDEVERRGAERLRRAVPESELPSARLRSIRVVERGRYES